MMDAPDLQTLLNLDKGAYVEQASIDTGRANALKDAACSLGARAGLARRSKEVIASLEKNKDRLDQVYSFQSVMLEFGIVPPVITKQERSADLQGYTSVSYAGITYRIEEPAKFVLAPPTWRSYVYRGLDTSEVDLPPKSLLPNTAEERKLWEENVSRCWVMGVEQAQLIVDNNMKLLKRDFLGMIRYKLLAIKGEVSMPQVSTKFKGRENRGKELRIDQRDYSIEQPVEFGRGTP